MSHDSQERPVSGAPDPGRDLGDPRSAQPDEAALPKRAQQVFKPLPPNVGTEESRKAANPTTTAGQIGAIAIMVIR